MSPGRFQFPFLASAVCALAFCSSPAQASDNVDSSKGGTTQPQQKIWDAEMPDQPAQIDKHPTRHKLAKIAKGLGKEVSTEVTDFGKDAILVFSDQDVDPYDEKAPKNKPYRMLDVQLVDGTTSSVIKYPDGSGRISGGFADGTVIIPDGPNQYVVKYPNGLKGRLERTGSGSYKIFRPDNTVTTVSREAGGAYSISNDKIGFMGTATSDETGLTFDLH